MADTVMERVAEPSPVFIVHRRSSVLHGLRVNITRDYGKWLEVRAITGARKCERCGVVLREELRPDEQTLAAKLRKPRKMDDATSSREID